MKCILDLSRVIVLAIAVGSELSSAFQDIASASSSSLTTTKVHVLVYETDALDGRGVDTPSQRLVDQINYRLDGISASVFGSGQKADDTFAGFGSKFSSVVPYLYRIGNANEDALVVISDSRDVLVNNPFNDNSKSSGLADEFRIAFDELTASKSDSIVISAEAQCCVSALTHVPLGDYYNTDGTRKERACSSGAEGCLWAGDDKAEPWESFMNHRMVEHTSGVVYDDAYLNAGLMVGKAKDLLRIIKAAQIADNEDDQAVWTDYMYHNPDNVVLDYQQRLFGNNRGGIASMEHGGCVFEKQAGRAQLVHVLTSTSPLFLHSPGGFFQCHDKMADELGVPKVAQTIRRRLKKKDSARRLQCNYGKMDGIACEDTPFTNTTSGDLSDFLDGIDDNSTLSSGGLGELLGRLNTTESGNATTSNSTLFGGLGDRLNATLASNSSTVGGLSALVGGGNVTSNLTSSNPLINSTSTKKIGANSSNPLIPVPVPAPVAVTVPVPAPVAVTVPVVAKSGPMDSCSVQNECINFTYEKITSSAAMKCGGAAEFRVCAKLNLNNPRCVKAGTVSHTCVKSDGICMTTSALSKTFAGAKETASISDGHLQCQNGVAGESLQFLFKDGSGCSGSATFAPTLSNEVSASCLPRPTAINSCTGNGVGKECVWTVTVPNASTSSSPLAPSPLLGLNTTSPLVGSNTTSTIPFLSSNTTAPIPLIGGNSSTNPLIPALVPVPAPVAVTVPVPAPAAVTVPVVAKSGPMDSCSAQNECINFTYEKITSSAAMKCGGAAEFRVCAKLNLNNPRCVKAGTVSHTCVKSDGVCMTTSTSSKTFAGAKETVGISDGHLQCQNGVAGESLQFLFKDGSGCSGAATFAPALSNEVSASCLPRPTAINSCTGNGVGKECVWTVTVPNASTVPVPLVSFLGGSSTTPSADTTSSAAAAAASASSNTNADYVNPFAFLGSEKPGGKPKN